MQSQLRQLLKVDQLTLADLDAIKEFYAKYLEKDLTEKITTDVVARLKGVCPNCPYLSDQYKQDIELVHEARETWVQVRKALWIGIATVILSGVVGLLLLGFKTSMRATVNAPVTNMTDTIPTHLK